MPARCLAASAVHGPNLAVLPLFTRATQRCKVQLGVQCGVSLIDCPPIRPKKTDFLFLFLLLATFNFTPQSCRLLFLCDSLETSIS